jgi:hypothetical protein
MPKRISGKWTHLATSPNWIANQWAHVFTMPKRISGKWTHLATPPSFVIAASANFAMLDSPFG